MEEHVLPLWLEMVSGTSRPLSKHSRTTEVFPSGANCAADRMPIKCKYLLRAFFVIVNVCCIFFASALKASITV
eukprot:6492012-Amphidinium_carterae.1